MMEIIGKMKHYVPRGYGVREVERSVGRCVCGNEVPLLDFINTCERCGRDYNMLGSLLAPRSQWGEETGESISDILRPFSPGEDWY